MTRVGSQRHSEKKINKNLKKIHITKLDSYDIYLLEKLRFYPIRIACCNWLGVGAVVQLQSSALRQFPAGSRGTQPNSQVMPSV